MLWHLKCIFGLYFIHENKIYEQNNNTNSRTDYTYFQPSKSKICWGFQTLQCFTLIRNFYFLLGKFFISPYSHVAHSLTVTAYTRYLYKNVFDFFLSYFSLIFFSKLYIICLHRLHLVLLYVIADYGMYIIFHFSSYFSGRFTWLKKMNTPNSKEKFIIFRVNKFNP